MSNRSETELTKLESEGAALKVAFQRQAKTLEVQSQTRTGVTPPDNQYSASNAKVISNVSVSYMSGVRITLNTQNGENVIAKIVPHARRVPYEGGAQWIYTGSPAVSEDFTIYSNIPGEISIGAI